jgi:hypothetical protein
MKYKRFSEKPRKLKIVRFSNKHRRKFPDEFPFWARMKISKNRTTLVIDEEPHFNPKTKGISNVFVHRESTHTKKKDYEEIYPNPDPTDTDPMYLKRPRKHPQELFKPHNKNLQLPPHLKERYKNNNK